MGIHKHSSQTGTFGCTSKCFHTEFILFFPSSESPSGFITVLQQLHQSKGFCINYLNNVIIRYN